MAWRRRQRARAVAGAVLHEPVDETRLDPQTGAVTSRQSADIDLPAAELTGLWDPEHLERVARTYWSTLRRFALGLIHVAYSERERSVVLLVPRLPLLTFRLPEYEMDRNRGIVRWRIDRGLLVSRRGRGGDGYLEIEIERRPLPDGDRVRLRVSVEVANYYPSLTGISRPSSAASTRYPTSRPRSSTWRDRGRGASRLPPASASEDSTIRSWVLAPQGQRLPQAAAGPLRTRSLLTGSARRRGSAVRSTVMWLEEKKMQSTETIHGTDAQQAPGERRADQRVRLLQTRLVEEARWARRRLAELPRMARRPSPRT